MLGILRNRLPSAVTALLGIAAITFVCYRLHASATVAAILLFFAVLVVAQQGKIAESMVASVAATLCLDYFFVPPLLSISIGDPEGWVALLVFLAASLGAAKMSGELRRSRDQLVASNAESERLHALSRAMLLGGGSEDVARLIVNKCIELFGARDVVLFDSGAGVFYRSESRSSVSEEKLRSVALNGSIQQSQPNGEVVLPVALGNRTFGSLGLRGVEFGQQALQTLGSTVALGLAQSQAQEASSRAEAVRRGEELKSVMIDALAHDLKTPLTAIEASADMLGRPADISDAQRGDLVSVVQEEARGLRRLVDEAIHLARIDAKKLKLHCEPTSVADVIAKAIQSLGERLVPDRIRVALPGDLPMIDVDEELVVQALKQLLDNAIKYGSSDSPVTVSARHEEGLVSIAVRDHGVGITELEQTRIFNKFYRGRQDGTGVQGSGMGLAITKEIVQAHGGSVTVESKIGEGSLFTLQLHALPQNISAPAEVRAE
ncbi:MAG: DUF4118 domain-containing protein [Acidobacteriaceae bacterium]|nr:DUF4118 domain-containing protein [Acidobacteriaceae bacterium]